MLLWRLPFLPTPNFLFLLFWDSVRVVAGCLYKNIEKSFFIISNQNDERFETLYNDIMFLKLENV